MVLSDIVNNLADWFVINNESKEEVVKEEVIKEEHIYIILVNGSPYGYYHNCEETAEQLEYVKEHVVSKHMFDFSKTFYWTSLQGEKGEYLKTTLVSNLKNNITRYDYLEESVEIIKSYLLPLKKVL